MITVRQAEMLIELRKRLDQLDSSYSRANLDILTEIVQGIMIVLLQRVGDEN